MNDTVYETVYKSTLGIVNKESYQKLSIRINKSNVFLHSFLLSSYIPSLNKLFERVLITDHFDPKFGVRVRFETG